MPLLEDNRFIDDPWQVLDDGAGIPETGDIIVAFSRLVAEASAFTARRGRLGTRLPNAERAEGLTAYLPELSLVVLEFPQFVDGRAYSQARVLRQLGFAGQLRATGNVLPDQLSFMLEVGFDAFEVADRFPPELWQRTWRGLSLSYQPVSQPDRLHVWQARNAHSATRLA